MTTGKSSQVSLIIECEGVTKNGTKCKNLGVYPSENRLYCYWHVPRLSSDCVRLSCGHLFHKTCIRKWFRTSRHCPICREKN
jgi:hypothetical protein